MAITSHLLWGLVFLSTFLGLTLQDCPANVKLLKFFKSQIKIEMMTADRLLLNNPQQALHYVNNYPIELINRSFSTRIDSAISLQKMEVSFLKQNITFRLKQIKSQTSLLISFKYYDSVWKNLAISVLLFDKAFYPSIIFGQLSATNQQSRVQLDAAAKLPTSFKQTSAKVVTYLMGLDCFRKNPSDFLFNVQLTDKLDLTLSQITVTIKIGDNTELTEIYLGYIIFSQNKNYEVSGSYETFENIGREQHNKYLGDKISSNNYFLAGISSFSFKKDPGPFYLEFKLKPNAQNLLELQSNSPVSILKIGIFRIGNTAKKLCENCPQKTIFNIAPSTTCVAACPGTTIKDPLDQTNKCITCSTEGNFQMISGKCQCSSQFSYYNGECLSGAQTKLVNNGLNPTFSRSDYDCVDPNSHKDQSGKCACKPGYIDQQGTCQNMCSFGFYDGQNCVFCPEGTYPLNDQQTCWSCSSECKSCQSEFICRQCNVGYDVNNLGKCEQACGDGVMKNSEECDDRNKLDGDGCSSHCKIEYGYKCTLDQAQGRSFCSKNEYNITFYQTSFVSGNLIILFMMSPPPQKLYAQDEIQQKIKLTFKSSPPYQSYIVHNATDLSQFRIVCAYGGNAPMAAAVIDIQVEDPAGRQHNQEIKKQFVSDGRSFSRRTSLRDSSRDILT